MLLTELTISNYKSFFEETVMRFGPGFNLLLGANSTGKTTVLEAIRFLDLPNLPHRSLANIVEFDTHWDKSSQAKARFDLRIDQLQKLISYPPLRIALNDDANHIARDEDAVLTEWKTEPAKIEFIMQPGSELSCRFCTFEKKSVIRRSGQPIPSWFADIYRDRINFSATPTSMASDNMSDVNQLATIINQRIYRFSAERVVRAYCGFSHAELAPDASNLAFCINHLGSNNPLIFDKLNSYLHRIFPNIFSVGAVPHPGGSNFELKVHTVPRSADRTDLAIPIDRVGTGVSNAIAMLYVVLTARTPRIILLEEPNSFLHPRALRELLTILAEAGKQHQFFITTHSSDVLRSVPASTVTLLEYDGVKTTTKQTMQKGLNVFQAGLLDLGIRLTDLHGCDRVLWVEGETEEAIFPTLLSYFFPDIAQGIATLRLHATGDFESRKIKPGKVAEIYRKLSQSTFLAPPMVAITLDREGKQQSQVDSMIRECEGTVFFLPRPMLEDYFLVPEAIAEVLYAEFGISVDNSAVEEALRNARSKSENKILPKSPIDSTLHAAKMLGSIFFDLGGDGVIYDKTRHGPLLASWILAKRPEEFDELREWFENFIKPEMLS